MKNSLTSTGKVIEDLIAPNVVALVGARDEDNSVGGRVLRSLEMSKGTEVVGINPHRTSLHGEPCWPTLDALPPDVVLDQVIFCIPGSGVPGLLGAARRRGAKSAVVFSGGFIEAGNRALNESLSAAVAESGLTLLGPNCYGYVNLVDEKYATGSAHLMFNHYLRGPISIVSQSGGLGFSIIPAFAAAVGGGIARIVNVGNQIATGVEDVVSYLAGDPATKVIVLVVEGVRDGPKLVEAVTEAKLAGKDVFYIKIGRSEGGRRSVLSHTGSFAGDQAVFDGLMRSAGAVAFDEPREIAEAAAFAGRLKTDSVGGVGIASISGGGISLLVDALGLEGIPVPTLSEKSLERMGDSLPDYAHFTNPIDLTTFAISDAGPFATAIDTLASDAAIDLGIGILTQANGAQDVIRRTREDVRGEVAWVWWGTDARAREDLLLGGEPWAVSAHTVASVLRSRQAGGHSGGGDGVGGGADAAGEADGAAAVDPTVVEGWVEQAGVRIPRAIHATGAAGLGKGAIEDLRFPVVVKAGGSRIGHKARRGLVALNVRSPELALLLSHEFFGDDAVETVEVQEQVGGELELFFGTWCDAGFGRVALLGAGGAGVEGRRDVCYAKLPLSRAGLERLASGSHAGRAWLGLAGRERALSTIERLCQIAVSLDRNITSFEINPGIVTNDGEFVAVDCKAFIDTSINTHEE